MSRRRQAPPEFEWHKKRIAELPDDHPDKEQALLDYRAAKLARRIAEELVKEPPLTVEHRRLLARMLTTEGVRKP